MAHYRLSISSENQQLTGINTHPDYNLYIEDWEKIRDAIQGAGAIKARKTRYLPGTHKQEETDYDKYIARAVFFNATRRTREAIVGLILRKTPELTLDKSVEKRSGDIDMAGSTIKDYLRKVTEETSSLGRSGTMIDWSETESRAYFAFYHAEDIIDWQEERIDSRMTLTRILLREISFRRSAMGDDNKATGDGETVQKMREFTLKDKVVSVRTWEIINNSVASGKQENELKHRGANIGFIPFVFHSLEGNKSDVSIPPLSDLADLNISHYQSSADLENGRHVAGMPTPWATGFDTKDEFILGTSHIWVSEDANAKAGFLEFTGQGLSALERAITEKQGQMAALGARIIEPQTGDAEAFQTVQLRSNSEQATLVNLAESVSATLSKCFQYFAWWESTKGIKPDDLAEANNMVLNTDFVSSKIDPQSLTSIVQAFQGGQVSWPTFFYNLQQGEFYKEGWTQEDEERALEQTPVSFLPPTEPEPGTKKKADDPPAKE